MKRSLISGLILLLTLGSRAQDIELQGEYQAFFLGAETIDFVGRDSFYFNGFYCTHGLIGKGRCAIKDGNLYLYFEKLEKKKRFVDWRPPVISMMNSADSIKTVELDCLVSEKENLCFASVIISSRGKTLKSYLTDSVGHLTFSVLQSDFPLTIYTSAQGAFSRETKLKDPANYTVKIFHAKGGIPIKRLNKGQVFVYEIEDISPDKIVMRRPVGKGQFYEYKKVHDQLNP